MAGTTGIRSTMQRHTEPTRRDPGLFFANPDTGARTFYVLLAVLVLPVLIFDVFPSQDGPAHLGNAAIYLGSEVPLDTYFEIQWWPLVPNMLVDMVLGALLLVTSPFVAERILVFALLVGLPLAVRWCLLHLDRRDSVWPSILAIPLGANLLLFFGFYGFLLGLTLCLAALAYWMKTIRSGEIRSRAVVVMAVSMLLVYMSHPLPLIALIVLTSAASFDHWLERRTHEKMATRIARRQAVAISLASAGPMLLLAIYALDQQGDGIEYGRPLLTRLAAMPVDALVTFSNWEIPFAFLVSAGILSAGVLAFRIYGRSAIERPGFLVAALLFAVVYLASPNEIDSGGVVLPRLALLAMIASVLWLGTVSLPRWAYTTITVIAVVATVGLTVVRVPAQAERHSHMAEFATAVEVIQEGATVLPLWGQAHVSAFDSRIEFPRKTWSGYLMAAKNAVDLSHFPAYTDAFPLAFRPQFDIRATSDPEAEAFVLGRPLVHAPEYASQSEGGEIDYVLVWGDNPDDPGRLDSSDNGGFSSWLESEYERAFVSSPHGLLQIYERSQ